MTKEQQFNQEDRAVSNQMDKEAEYRSKKQEVLSKFHKEFIDNYYTGYDPVFRHILELLYLDADPYSIIESLIGSMKTSSDTFKEYVLNSVNPQKYNFVVIQNKILLDALKKIAVKYPEDNNPDSPEILCKYLISTAQEAIRKVEPEPETTLNPLFQDIVNNFLNSHT